MLAVVLQVIVPLVAVAALFWVTDVWAGGRSGGRWTR